MIEQKKHDWLATLFFSPDKSPQDLADLGITVNNSSLQDRDYYKNMPQIQEAFRTDSGTFDDATFNKYYQEVQNLYSNEELKNVIGNITNTYTYDPYDYFAPSGSKERDLTPSLISIVNPQRRVRGATNLFEASAPTMSTREVAQQNNIFNSETGEFEDWTPNDWGGLKALTRPTLVLAQYDEDTEEIIDGRVVKHYKGELKFNEKGDPYYETLGDRATTGKDILHISDTLSVDGSKWNKYDFFDSDGLDKSVGSTLAKTIFKVAPMFIPGFGQYYGGLTAAIELNKLGAVLTKAVDGIIKGDTSNSKVSQLSNNWQAWWSRFDSSTSDYGKTKFFTIEGIGNLIESSSMQLFQQKTIANIPKWLKDLNKSQMTENAVNWGRGMSLAYMAGTSSIEAYDAFKEAGGSDRTAGLGMIATMLGMHKLMTSDYLNYEEFLFKGSYLDKSNVKKALTDVAKDIVDNNINKNTLTPKEAANWLKKSTDYIVNKFKNLNPDSLFRDALTEGVEETMEESVMDAIKGVFAGFNALGLVNKDKKLNFGFSAEDILSRYTTAFIGGGIGGAVFGLHRKYGPDKIHRDPNLNNGDHFKELVALIRNGKKDELKSELDRLHKKGKLGSINLSGVNFELVKDGDTQKIQYKNAEKGESQNDVIYTQIDQYIDRIDEMIKEEGLDLTDEELQLAMQIANDNNEDIESVKAKLTIFKAKQRDEILDNLLSQGLTTTLFEDWNTLTEDIIKTKSELENLLTPTGEDSVTGNDFASKLAGITTSTEYKTKEKKLQELRKKRDELVSGKHNDFYVSQLLYAGSPHLVSAFVDGFGIHEYTKYKYKKEYDELNQEDKQKIDEEYLVYTNGEEKRKVIDSHKLYLSLNEELTEHLNGIKPKINTRSELTGETLFSIRSKELDLDIQNLQEQITDLDAAKDSAEIERLNSLIKTKQDEKDKLNSDSLSRILPLFTENSTIKRLGSSVITSAQDELDAMNTYASTYLQYLKSTKSKSYYDKYDADLINILRWSFTKGDITELGVFEQMPENSDEWVDKILRVLSDEDISGLSKDQFTSVGGLLQHLQNAADKGDLDEIKKTYTKIKDLDLWGLYIDDSEELLNKILPKINGQNLIDFVNEVITLKSEKSNPVYELVAQIANAFNFDGQELIEVLDKEIGSYLSSDIQNYLIKNPKSLEQLKTLVNLLNIAQAILLGSSENGHNARVNIYRDNKLAELPSDVIDQLNAEFNLLKNRLNGIIEIAELNNNRKLSENRDIGLNVRGKFIKLWLEDGSNGKKLLNNLGINLSEVLENVDIPNEVTLENIDQWEYIGNLIETEIYKQTHDISGSKHTDDLIKSVVDLFDLNELIKMKRTELTKDPDLVITDYDQAMYFLSILAAPTQNFYVNFKKHIESNDKIAPIYSQEYAIRFGYSYIINPDLFNGFLEVLEKYAKNDKDAYIASRPIYRNLYTVLGGAGTGKTTAIAKSLQAMFPEATIVASAATKRQTSNLKNNLGNVSSFTKDELITKIYGKLVTSDDADAVKNSNDTPITYSWRKSIINSPDIFSKSTPKILIVDEIGLWNKIELEILTTWANSNNVVIVGLGDDYQDSAMLTVGEENYDMGIVDGLSVTAPYITAPMRPDNIAKLDNYIAQRVLLKQAHEKVGFNPTPHELDNAINSLLNSNPITFKFYETDGVFDGGSKIINNNESEIKKHIDIIASKSKSVAIITDDVSKYNGFKITYPHIKVIASNDVQGAEFDYIFVDKQYVGSDYYRSKNIYTITQRSKKGTILLNHGAIKNYRSILDQTSSAQTFLTQTQIDDFRQWRLDSLSKIPKDSIRINLPNTINDNTNISEDISTNTFTGKTIVGEASEGTIYEETFDQEQLPESKKPTSVIAKAGNYANLYNSMDETNRKYLKYIRDYIVYGHKRPGILYNKLNQEFKSKIFNGRELKEFTYEIRKDDGKKVLYAIFNDGKDLIPLFVMPVNVKLGSWNGSFTPVGLVWTQRETPSSLDINTAHDNNLFSISSPKILQSSKEVVGLADWIKRYAIASADKPLGKTFVGVSGDSLAEYDDFWKGEVENGAYKYAVNRASGIKLFGAQYYFTNIQDVIDAYKKGNQSVVNGHVAAEIILHIYHHESTSVSLKDTIKKGIQKYLDGKHYIVVNNGTKVEIDNPADIDKIFDPNVKSIYLYERTKNEVFQDNKGSSFIKLVLNNSAIPEIDSLPRNWPFIYGQDWVSAKGDLWSDPEGTTSHGQPYYVPKITKVLGDNFMITNVATDEQPVVPNNQPPQKQTITTTPPTQTILDSGTSRSSSQTIENNVMSKLEKQFGLSNRVGARTTRKDKWSIYERYYVNGDMTFINDSDWGNQIIKVSLQDGSTQYCKISNYADGNVQIKIVPESIGEAYWELISQLREESTINPMYEDVIRLLNITSKNPWESTNVPDISNPLWIKVENYLIAKLKNNEC